MSKRKRYSIRDATGSIQIFLKSSCEGAKRPTGGGGCGGGGGVPPPTMWSFFVFQCGIVCSGAYFRGDFHIFLHIISVFNWVLGTYCQIVKKKKKNPLFGNFRKCGISAQLIGLNWKYMPCQVLGVPFVSAWSVCARTHCPFIAPNSYDTFGGFRCNEWAVGTRAYTHKR